MRHQVTRIHVLTRLLGEATPLELERGKLEVAATGQPWRAAATDLVYKGMIHEVGAADAEVEHIDLL